MCYAPLMIAGHTGRKTYVGLVPNYREWQKGNNDFFI